MCRWFAYISPEEPCLLADVLLTPDNAITKQVSAHYLPYLLPHHKDHDLLHGKDPALRLRNSFLNYDGVGVAWYTTASSAYTAQQDGPRPSVYKSQSPATNDCNIHAICENNETNCLFAHVRASSGSAVTPINNHPFVFGRHTFMHNGTISDFGAIKRKLADSISDAAYANVRGTTDTEHAAALYMTYLCGYSATKEAWQREFTLDEMRDAMKKTISRLLEIQQQLLGSSAHASSLNFCATDGSQLVACRFRNHKTEQPASLYWSTSAGKTLNRKFPGNPNLSLAAQEESGTELQVDTHTTVATEPSSLDKKQSWHVVDKKQHGTHTIVSSEPTTFIEEEWTLFDKNSMILVGRDGSVAFEPVTYNSKLDFES